MKWLFERCTFELQGAYAANTLSLMLELLCCQKKRLLELLSKRNSVGKEGDDVLVRTIKEVVW